MDEIFFLGVAVILPTVVIAGGILVVLMAMYQRGKTLEMQHRERLAMIERGLTPPLESAPGYVEIEAVRRQPAAPHRYTTLGVALISLGLGLMLIIGFAGAAPGPAIGVGGAVALLGVAFIVNGYLQRGHQAPPGPSTSSDRVGP
jgi:hypothetical protein